jgi:MFS family permease
LGGSGAVTYRRDAFTWTAFGALFAFGYLNAVLGPSLPYLRSVEGISYLVGALHQAAFAVGGGLAGILSARERIPVGRRTMIVGGLMGAAIAGLGLAYGDTAPLTIAAALLMGLLATLALIRVWAALADAHGPRRAVAMTEGEVSVSLAGIATPLLIGALAATAGTWRLALAIGAAIAIATSVAVLRADVPPTHAPGPPDAPHGRVQATLVIVFAIVALEFTMSFWLATYLNDDVGLARGAAVAMVSGLYASNLLGRLAVSRAARTQSVERLLGAALATVLVGLPFLLCARAAGPAIAGIVLAGAGIGALFPLTSSLHVQASGRTADSALGSILAVAALGQIFGPLAAGAMAQAASLRAGLLVLPAATLLAAATLAAHVERARAGHGIHPRPMRSPAGARSLRRSRTRSG